MGNLTVTAIEKSLKPKDKKYTAADGGGLSLEIMPNGSKRWRYRYRYEGLPQTLSFGLYPDVSLKEAREKHADARKLVANGINPSTVRKAQKVSHGGADSFEVIAREWHQKHLHKWTPSHGEQILRRLEQNIFPWLGKKAIKSITPPQLLEVLRRMEKRGALETTHRVRASCGQIMRATKENEGDAWAPIQDWFIKLRTEGVSVLLIHHAGKNGEQRGSSRIEDCMDIVMQLKRPEDYRQETEGARFELHFTKTRHLFGAATQPLDISLVPYATGLEWCYQATQSKYQQALELLKAGTVQTEIADMLGVHKATISKWKKTAEREGTLTP